MSRATLRASEPGHGAGVLGARESDEDHRLGPGAQDDLAGEGRARPSPGRRIEPELTPCSAPY